MPRRNANTRRSRRSAPGPAALEFTRYGGPNHDAFVDALRTTVERSRRYPTPPTFEQVGLQSTHPSEWKRGGVHSTRPPTRTPPTPQDTPPRRPAPPRGGGSKTGAGSRPPTPPNVRPSR